MNDAKLKENAKQFLLLASSGHVEEAYALTHPNFVHHNQYFGAGKESLKNAMLEDYQKNPIRKFEVQFQVAEGDRVVSYSRVKFPDLEFAVFHAMRFEEDLIAELWDLGQASLKDSPNTDGIF